MGVISKLKIEQKIHIRRIVKDGGSKNDFETIARRSQKIERHLLPKVMQDRRIVKNLP